MEKEKCACGEEITFGKADVEIGGTCHRVDKPCYVIPHPTTDIEEILRLFDEKLECIDGLSTNLDINFLRDKILEHRKSLKDYFRQSLTSYASTREARLREEIWNMRLEYHTNGTNLARMVDTGIKYIEYDSYNQALTDVLALFTKETSNE